MNKRVVQKALADAIKATRVEMRANSHTFFGAGLASEGYAGGYRDALSDVSLLLDGLIPTRRNYWDFLRRAQP